MGTVNPKYQGRNGNEVTYEALTAVTGGQLVIPQTGATASGCQGIQPAGAGALNVLGVAQADALPTATIATDTNETEGFDSGYPVVDTSVPDATVAVYTDVIIGVTYTSVAVAYGARLKAAAAGAVAAFVHGTDDPAMVIGWCAQPGGTAGGVVALARILA